MDLFSCLYDLRSNCGRIRDRHHILTGVRHCGHIEFLLQDVAIVIHTLGTVLERELRHVTLTVSCHYRVCKNLTVHHIA